MFTSRCVIPGTLVGTLVGILFVWSVFSIGCTAPLNRVEGVVEGVVQDDVPQPPRFTVRDSWMYSHPESPVGFFRSCVTEFVGRGQLKDLTSWYLDAMNEKGWRRDDVDIGSTRTMTFTKNAEYAKVLIFREFNTKDKKFETVLKVEIGPQRTEDVPVWQVIPAPGSGNTPGQSERSESEIGKFAPVKPYETEISVLPDEKTTEIQTRRASLDTFSPEVLPASSSSSDRSTTSGLSGRLLETSTNHTSDGRGPLLDEAVHGPPLPDVLEDISDGSE